MFDDGLHAALRIEHEATVAMRVLRYGAEHRKAPRRVEQSLQALGANQRDVAIQHQHRSAVGHGGHGLLHGVPGAQLLCLLGPVQIRLVGESRFHLLAAMAVHHVDGAGTERAGRIDHVAEHGLASDRLQHLGPR